MEEIRVEYDKGCENPEELGNRLFLNYSQEEQAIFNGYLDAYLDILEDYPYAAMSCYIINDYISDDTLFYFNLWLISQGEDVVKNVLRNPDRLADMKAIPWGGAEFEDLLSIRPMSDHQLMKQQIEEIKRTVDELSFYMTTSLNAYKDADEVLADAYRRLPDLVELSEIMERSENEADEEDEFDGQDDKKQHFLYARFLLAKCKLVLGNKKYRKKNQVLDQAKAQFLTFGSMYIFPDMTRCVSPMTTYAEQQKKIYKQWWGVSNRSEMLEMVDDLSVGAVHTPRYIMQTFDFDHPIVESLITQINKEMEMEFLTIEDFKRCQTVLAWDLERGANLARTSVGIGYFSERETYEYLRVITKTAQESFQSWKEYIVSFISGRLFWCGYADEEGFFSELVFRLKHSFFGTYDDEEQQPLYLEFPLSSIGKSADEVLDFIKYGLPLPKNGNKEAVISNQEKLLQTHSLPNKKQIKELDFWKDRSISPIHKAFFSSFALGTIKAFQKSIWFGIGTLLVTLIYGIVLLSREGKSAIFEKHSLIPAVLCGEEKSELFTLIPIQLEPKEKICWLAYKLSFPQKDFSAFSQGELIPCVIDRNEGEDIAELIKKTEIHPLHYGYTKESVIAYAKSILNSHPVYPKQITTILNSLAEECGPQDILFLDEHFQQVFNE
ncbi:hypothetical protein RV18_GL003259 [Enterococcus termitis]|nr:hypothetical protein RV18_GL003259 [Enterococcus termitis]